MLVAAVATAAISRAATTVIAPYVQDVRSNGAAVLWVTGENGAGVVEYSADRIAFRAVPAQVRRLAPPLASQPVYQYQAELTGLIPGQEYLYRVLTDGEVIKDGLRFRTAGPGPFTFLAFGDSGTGGPDQAQLARLIVAEREPALVLHTGDLCQDRGTFECLQSHYFGVYAPLMSRTPFFPTPGNHDHLTDSAAPYLALLSPPEAGVPAADTGHYYSFGWGNVHFVSLDSNLLTSPAAAERMLEWLERDLSRQSQYWKVAYFHHAPYPTGHHASDPVSELVRQRVVPVLERHGVQLALSGHEHSYQRSFPLRDGAPVESGSGTVYITTGGGGGRLHSIGPSPLVAFGEPAHHYLRVEVQSSRITVTAIGIDGRGVDSVTLAPPPRIASGGVVNAASFTSALAPGSLISVFGENLAFENREAAATPLPYELAGTRVTLNQQALPLTMVSPAQINAQLPYGLVGPATLRVSTPNSSAEEPVVLVATAPAILQAFNGFGRGPAVVRAGGGMVSPVWPARRGERVTIYTIGLGPVEGNIAAGQPAPASPPLGASYPVEVRLGDLSLTPAFAGLSPGFVGLYLVEFRIPDDLDDGMYALRVVANGASSDTVYLPVGSAVRPGG